MSEAPAQTDATSGNAPLSPVQQAIATIRTLRARLQAAEQRATAQVAIIGMSCRFPGADDLGAFWRLLSEGIDAIGDIPPDRWNIDALYDPDPGVPGKISTRYGGFLTDIADFDADFFGISDREAISVDPQHRLLLEGAREALDDAGLTNEALFGSRTGVFVGISSFDYASLRGQGGDVAQLDAYHAAGVSHSAAAGRLAYYLGLQGPAIAIDTACSSSLAAIHLACQNLRLRDCDAALAGGVNLILSPELHVTLTKARMLAPDGRCKAFAAGADGFVRSEGCGILVLKLLDDALRDGDRIHAVIRGSACNQDGRSSGLSAPNGPAQTAVVRAAWKAAGVRPEQIDYVEAHGTGTALGDPIEAGALAAAFADTPRSHLPWIGSVKSNLGHMEAAAGVGGVIKTVLALKHERLPASLHCKMLSPEIDWTACGLKVIAEATPWARKVTPRFAGVSSFGFSGTNVHIVIEEAPSQPPPPGNDSTCRILTISAADDAALRQTAERFCASLTGLGPEPSAWPDFTYTANARRSHFASRAAVVARSPAEAVRTLAALAAGPVAAGDACPGLVSGRVDVMRAPSIGFFAGSGVAHPAADPRQDELYRTSEAFRTAIDACALWLEGSPDAAQAATRDRLAFATQWALARTWMAWGLSPDIVAGAGVGSYVAACLAGVLSLQDAMVLVTLRADRQDQTGLEPRRAEQASEAFRAAAAAARFSAPKLPLWSGALRRTFDPGEIPAAADWLKAIDASFRPLADAADFGARHPDVLLDLGRNRIAAPERRQTDDPRDQTVPGRSLRHDMLVAASELYVRGAPIDWRTVEGPRPGRAVDVPRHPWSRRRHWFPSAATTGSRPPTEASWQAIVADTGRQADQVPIDLLLHTYAEKYRRLGALANAYMIRSFVELGAFTRPGEVLTIDEIVGSLGVLPLYRQLLAVWLGRLANEGWLTRVDAGFTASPPLTTAPITALEAEAEPVFTDSPMLLEYVKRCGVLLTPILRGATSALETLFPGGGFELADAIYHRAPLSRYFNAIAAEAARSFASGRPGKISILEVGGGTGGVTASILPRLPADRATYTFTDVSPFFFEAAARRFSAFEIVLGFAVLDLERPPQAQGFRAGSYDLVVAANVLHATAHLGRTLDIVRGLLAPGGALLLYEVTDPPVYFDVSIALIEGWQKSSDDIRGVGPLLNTDQWKDLLPRHGFDRVEAWPSVTSPANVLGSRILMVRADGAETGSLAGSPGDVGQRKGHVVRPAPMPEAAEDMSAILDRTPESEHRQVLVEFVRRKVAQVLRRPTTREIAADQRLMDLGLDSLMAVELRNALTRDLSLTKSLPATLMFDHPSIAAIADFLFERLHPEARAAPPEAQGASAAATPAAVRTTAAQLAALSDADVETLLNSKLALLSREPDE